MTEYQQHQQRLQRVLMSVNEAIQELNEAREDAAKAQAIADPLLKQRAAAKLEQAELRAMEMHKALKNEANQSQEQQVIQNLNELQNAMDNARQF